MPSLTRLSARSTVTVRRGRSRARTPTAVASVGASAAPSTHAGPHSSPNPCAATATAAAVATTRAVLLRTTTRRLLRISRSEVVRLSQYRSAGRKSRSTTSGGSCAWRSCGTNPRSTPTRTSRIAGATGYRRASAPHMTIATPSSTTISSPSTGPSWLNQPADGSTAGQLPREAAGRAPGETPRADPDNTAARELLAAALIQLGYGAERAVAQHLPARCRGAARPHRRPVARPRLALRPGRTDHRAALRLDRDPG